MVRDVRAVADDYAAQGYLAIAPALFEMNRQGAYNGHIPVTAINSAIMVLAALLGLTTGEGGVVLPLLATQILWINLITDSAPALAMGVDPSVEVDIFERDRR